MKSSYVRRTENQKASTLLICLAIMMVLAVMGVSLVRLSGIDRDATKNYTETSAARMVAVSGIEYAVARLRERYASGANLIDTEMTDFTVINNRDWVYWVEDDATNHDRTNVNSDPPEDWVGAGIRLENLCLSLPADTHPSLYREGPSKPSAIFPANPNNRKVTLLCNYREDYEAAPATEKRPYIDGSRQSLFTLKVLDTTSQINLNMQMDPNNPQSQYPPGTDVSDANTANDPPICTILNNLSRAVAELPWYTGGTRDLVNGPFRGLGAQIIAERIALGGFNSKWELVGINDGVGNEISREDVSDIWDFITVYPTVNEYLRNPTTAAYNPTPYLQIRPAQAAESLDYQEDYRSPINVNTASWPVLVALFEGLSGDVDGDGTDEVISNVEARAIATAICEKRSLDDPFDDRAEWNDFLDDLTTDTSLPYLGGTPMDSNDVEMIRAMSNPAATLNRVNPDRFLSREIEKAGPISGPDVLTFYTTEVCFFPYGFFEITSLGEVLDTDNRVMGSAKANTVVRLYDMVRLHTQQHFDATQGAGPQKFQNQQEACAFASGNNIEAEFPDPPTNTSQYFGYVQPIVSYTDWFTDKPSQLGHLSGSLKLIQLSSWDTLKFRADFNGTLTPEEMHDGSGIATARLLTAKSAADVLPNTDDQVGDLASDGILFYSPDTATLCYEPPNSMTENGAVSFWTKLRQFPSSSWTPVFFMTQPMGGLVLGRNYGIQTYIAMRYAGNTFSLRAGRKFYVSPLTGLTNNTTDAEVLDDILKDFAQDIGADSANEVVESWAALTLDEAADRRVGLQEWYHTLVRWQDEAGIDDESIGGAEDPSYCGLLFSGNFYDASDPDVMISGPIFNDYADGREMYQYVGVTTDMVDDWVAKFAPWYPDEVTDSLPAQGRMYFGNIPGSFSAQGHSMSGNIPPMTMDDLRLSTPAEFDAADPADYLPSRYRMQQLDGPGAPYTETVATFQGQMPGILETFPGSGIPQATAGASFISVSEWNTSFSSGGPMSVTPVFNAGTGQYTLYFEAPLTDMPMYQAPVIAEVMVSYQRRNLEMLFYQWLHD